MRKFSKVSAILAVILAVSSCGQSVSSTSSVDTTVSAPVEVEEPVTLESMMQKTESDLALPDYTEEEEAAFESGDVETILKSEHCKQFMIKALEYFAGFDSFEIESGQ